MNNSQRRQASGFSVCSWNRKCSYEWFIIAIEWSCIIVIGCLLDKVPLLHSTFPTRKRMYLFSFFFWKRSINSLSESCNISSLSSIWREMAHAVNRGWGMLNG